ncbi:hypothetical protein ATCC90586_006468 [Pythium insidiosum]|nr:hypothetical protein ATCC90586_006468 [Pythium insidiosum]
MWTTFYAAAPLHAVELEAFESSGCSRLDVLRALSSGISRRRSELPVTASDALEKLDADHAMDIVSHFALRLAFSTEMELAEWHAQRRVDQPIGRRHQGEQQLALTLENIDRIAESHFPLCMRHLHRKLRENHHLKYDGRVQYRMFLKGLGFTVQDSLIFFRDEFTRVISSAKFDREYAYHIRHSYGLEGSRKDYAPMDCAQIINGAAPRHGQHHGCPFKHWDTAALDAELRRTGLSNTEQVARITRLAAQRKPEAACSELFAALHGRHVAAKVLTEVTESKSADASNKRHKKEKKPKREFQMSKYAQRLVAIKFLYIGDKYDGFARQDHTEETIERYVFSALQHTKLIESIDSCEYSRCGRTDKGVSAFGQVVGIRVRSNLPVDAELLDAATIDEVRPGQRFRVKMPNGDERTLTELDYAVHINRALPDDIRVYAVVAAPAGFSARFDCRERMYRYFFVRKSLDIEKMRLGAAKLVGTHDYRNFCRIDTSKHTFERKIRSFEILPCDDHESKEVAQQMFRFEIYGQAFLWHQVRCMVQVLFLIGEGKEEPEIVDRLLDITATPRKPQYDMASDRPLCLQDCLFDNVEFEYSPLALHHVHEHVSGLWEQAAIKTAMLRSDLDMLEQFQVDPAKAIAALTHYAPRLEQLMQERGMTGACAWKEIQTLLPLAAKPKHIPLLARNTGFSVQEKKDLMKARKRRRQEQGEAVGQE